MRNYNLKLSVLIISLFFLLYEPCAANEFINTFISRISGNSLRNGDEVKLAKHDIIILNKFHYDDIRGDTWNAIKSINNKTEIYLYTDMNFVNSNTDNYNTVSLNNIGRYNVSRRHSMGSLNGSNPDLFLKDNNGNRVRDGASYLLDFGNTRYQNYASEATVTDHVGQPWTADGVYSDRCPTIKTGPFSPTLKYNTNAQWSAAMNDMINSMSASLSARGQEFACNRGPTYLSAGFNNWVDLDSSSHPPSTVLEESAFATGYGPGDIQFFTENSWKLQVDILSSIKNSKVCFLSSTDLTNTSSTGTDNWGKSFTYWDGLWYSLGSYLIGKNDIKNNSYFNFIRTSNYSNLDFYYDEYEHIDLGKATSSYKISNIGGRNIYWREFEYGYVYVNPTPNNVASISLPEPCKQITHTNFKSNIDNLPTKNSFALNSHRAAIFYKSDYQSAQSTTPPPSNNNSTIRIEAEDGTVHAPMLIGADNNAYSGEFIQVTSGSGGYSTYSFNVPESGNYYIWGRVIAPHAGANSFYISTDNGSRIAWHIPQSTTWDWDMAFSSYYAAGQHSIKVEQREYRTQLDQILLTKDPNYLPNDLGSFSNSNLFIEAEDGTVYAPMLIGTDNNASSGEFIQVTSGSGGYSTYSFNVPESGNYYIWGRVIAPHAGANSFYISTDNGSRIAWHIPQSTTWDWDMAFSSYYAAGQHSIKVEQREYRTQLDQILLTKDPNLLPNY